MSEPSRGLGASGSSPVSRVTTLSSQHHSQITEKMLLSAARLAKIGYWIWDHQKNTCVYCSEELAEMHNMRKDEYMINLGSSSNMFLWLTEDDRAKYRYTWEYYALKGIEYTVDIRMLRTDGDIFYARETGQPIFSDEGTLLYTAGTVQDISEFKLAYHRAVLAEQRLKDAIEALPDGFILFDSNDRFVLCNARYREMYAHIGDMLKPGVSFDDIMRVCHARTTGTDGEQNDSKWVERRIAVHKNADEPIEEKLPDGRWVRIVERITRQGENVGFRVDITDFKHQQRALNQLATDLQQQLRKANEANAAKNRFLARMSHELRTPLNAIIGFSEILERELFGQIGNQKYRDYAKQITESGNFLLSMVNDLIEVSRISSGVHQLHVSQHDLRSIVASVLPKLAPRARTAGVRLRARVGRGLPPVQADERALRQILMNLLTNAVKFTPVGGRVAVTVSVLKNGLVAVDVRDSGEGIPPDKIPHLGQPFRTLGEDPHKTENQSSGLGLAIVKGLAEEMGGRMTIHSDVGAGTRVRVTIPIAAEATAA